MRAKRLLQCVPLLALAGCVAVNDALNTALAAATLPPVLHEDFESPITGSYTVLKKGQSLATATNNWQITAASVDLVNVSRWRQTVAFDGNQVVDLAGSPGAGVMSTTIRTTPGQRYTLAFHYSRNNDLRAKPALARVEVIGAATLLRSELQHVAPAPFNTYQRFSAAFVADSPTTTLRFAGLNAGVAGLVIDAISVSGAAGVAAPRGAQ